MARNYKFPVLIALLCMALSTYSQASPASSSPSASVGAQGLAPLPRTFHFTENRGQWDERVLYKADGAGGLTYFIERDGFTLLYSMPDLTAKPLENPRDAGMPDEMTRNEPKIYPQKGHALKFKFIQSPTPLAANAFSQSPDIPSTSTSTLTSSRLSWNNNYFLGSDQSRWAPNCGNFGGVKLNDVWKGIDVEWYESNGHAEFDFVVKPGADPSQVGLYVDGLTGDLEVTGNGEELLLPTSLGTLRFTLPEAYQAGDGSKSNPVPAHFTVTDSNHLSLALPEGYDAGKKLIVDPLVYSTYLGGTGEDYAYALTSDGAGGVIVAGATSSIDFPSTEGALEESFNQYDSFATRLNAGGSHLIYSTYLGNCNVLALASDGGGGAIVAGYANDNFPTSEGAYQRNFGGEYDAFIARLNPQGNALIYSTYLGGSSHDYVFAITYEGASGVVVAGHTRSGDFPTTEEAFDKIFNGGAGFGADAFITHLNAEGSALIYSTYLGGSGGDEARTLTGDGTGGVFVAGNTTGNFPTTDGAYQRNFGGESDAFITHLNADGSALIYSTYLGGNTYDWASALTTDGTGGVVVAGYTNSQNFPSTDRAYQRNFGGNVDAFIIRLNSEGSALIYSTYLGGNGDDRAYALTPDGAGGVIVAGGTSSNDFPTTGGAYERNSAQGGAFISRLNNEGNALIYSTYLGGDSHVNANAISLDGKGDVVVAGQAIVNFPTTVGAYQRNHGGGDWDAFVTRLRFSPVILVPDYYATIHSAINASFDGDTILVAPGTYTENITLTGHNVTLASRYLYSNDQADIDATIIHGAGGNSVVSSGTNNSATLIGFIITGGSGHAGSLGGGVYMNRSKMTLEHCTITGNATAQGGGIYATASPLAVIRNCTINNNNATSCGGGISMTSSSLTLDHCTFSHNSAVTLGGGIRISGGHPSLQGCIISNNSAAQGGGANVSGNGTSFRNCTFDSNTAATLGGGMTISSSTATLDSCIFNGNNGGIQGGGLRIYNCGPAVTNSTFSNNTAAQGGGIYAASAGATHLTNDTLKNNTGTTVGGGIQLTSSNLTMDGCVISGNASPQGAGMRLYISSPTITRTAIVDNSAMTGAKYGGGFLCTSGSNPTFTRCTFSNNAARLGGLVWCYAGGNPTFNTCILYNDAPQEIYFQGAGVANSVSMAYCDLKGGQAGIKTNHNGTVTWGDGNFDINPSFVGGGDYHIAIGSPCIDTGDLGLTNDPDATRADVGAFFYDQGIHRAPGLDVPKEASETPKEFALNSSYPNPFNSFTTIRFSLKEDSKVRLTVYDLTGREVATLASGDLKAGSHAAVWNAEGFTSGIYLARLSTSTGFTATRKLTLMK